MTIRWRIQSCNATLRGVTAEQSRVRGPRAAQEIFNATLQLLAARGYDGLTVEGVAEASGVNKTTIYRWWSSKSALLAAAVVNARVLDIEVPDTGTLRGDLIAVADQVLALLTGHRTRAIMLAVFGAQSGDPGLSDLYRRVLADRLSRERPIFDRAVTRGELPADADPMLLMDLIGGAVWMRVLLRGQAPEPTFTARIVDTALGGVSWNRAGRRAAGSVD